MVACGGFACHASSPIVTSDTTALSHLSQADMLAEPQQPGLCAMVAQHRALAGNITESRRPLLPLIAAVMPGQLPSDTVQYHTVPYHTSTVLFAEQCDAHSAVLETPSSQEVGALYCLQLPQ
jgi:hypothetical protein